MFISDGVQFHKFPVRRRRGTELRKKAQQTQQKPAAFGICPQYLQPLLRRLNLQQMSLRFPVNNQFTDQRDRKIIKITLNLIFCIYKSTLFCYIDKDIDPDKKDEIKIFLSSKNPNPNPKREERTSLSKNYI